MKRHYVPQIKNHRFRMKELPELHQAIATRQNDAIPSRVIESGAPARHAWADFFDGVIANDLTRDAYRRAVRSFLNWPGLHSRQLHEITAADVGKYLREMEGSLSKKKQHLAGLRRFFDLLVERHVCLINPAAVARTERAQVTEGTTPRITERQSRRLLAVIDEETNVGKRDRAIVGILMWTGVRAGSIARLRRSDYYETGEQTVIRFDEKRRRKREIPVRSDLRAVMRTYFECVATQHSQSPMFFTARGNTDTFTDRPIAGRDISRMLKRYLVRAGLPDNLSPHSYRVAVATDLLEQGVPLSDVQYLLGHADPRTTRLYDRRQKRVTRNIVERIRLGVSD